MSESFVDRFEKELFTDEERGFEDDVKWRKYYDEENECFIPPYTLKEIKNNPKTKLEKFHICHYAYWMVISIRSPFAKPMVYGGAPECSCYACECALNNIGVKLQYRCNHCPVKWNEYGSEKCMDGTESLYSRWLRSPSEEEASQLAKEMALIPWCNPRGEEMDYGR